MLLSLLCLNYLLCYLTVCHFFTLNIVWQNAGSQSQFGYSPLWCDSLPGKPFVWRVPLLVLLAPIPLTWYSTWGREPQQVFACLLSIHAVCLSNYKVKCWLFIGVICLMHNFMVDCAKWWTRLDACSISIDGKVSLLFFGTGPLHCFHF